MSSTRTRTVEEKYLDALDEAVKCGEDVKDRIGSRENAVSLTNLETAKLWAQRDLEKKVSVS